MFNNQAILVIFSNMKNEVERQNRRYLPKRLQIEQK